MTCYGKEWRVAGLSLMVWSGGESKSFFGTSYHAVLTSTILIQGKLHDGLVSTQDGFFK